jgi:hypothetical protein
MGVWKPGISEPVSDGETPKPGNPNPARFIVLAIEKFRFHTVMMVSYPDCTNYEGKKILVFKGDPTGKIEGGLEFLEPHFCEKTNQDLVARFVPTDEGWRLACFLANLGSLK